MGVFSLSLSLCLECWFFIFFHLFALCFQPFQSCLLVYTISIYCWLRPAHSNVAARSFESCKMHLNHFKKTISMISFCSVRRELKHDSFEPFFLHILPLTEIYFRDCGNFEFQTHICTVEKKYAWTQTKAINKYRRWDSTYGKLNVRPASYKVTKEQWVNEE